MLRSWLTSKATISAAILTIALGTGVNTAVLSVAYGLLYRPLPHPESERLVVPGGEAAERQTVALQEAIDWRTRVRGVELAAYAIQQSTVRATDLATVIPTALVSNNFFAVMRTHAAFGRVFSGEPSPVAVISERLAARMGMDGGRDLGRAITIAGRPFDVIGVLPGSFQFPTEDVDVWVPAESVGGIAMFGDRDARRYQLVGRLADGITPAQASANVERVRRETASAAQSSRRLEFQQLQDVQSASMRPVIRAFVGAAILVLLVACANVATLLVGLAMSRERELAVRLAIGANPWRLVRSILVESVCLAAIGSALGLAIALGLLRVFAAYASGVVPNLGSIAIDGPVLGAAALTVALVTVVCGAAPAVFAAKTNFTSAFREAHASTGRSGRRIRGGLVVAQIALSIVLLTSAGLLARTVARLLHEDAGILPHDAIVAQMMLTDTLEFHAGDHLPVVRALLSRVRSLPGVHAAGAGSSIPPDNQTLEIGFRFDRRAQMTLVTLAGVTPGYLESLGMRLVKGRLFDERDLDAGGSVAIISEATASRLPGGPALIGRALPFHLSLADGRPHRPTIIGIVEDVKYTGLDNARGGAIYVPWTAVPASNSYLAVRTDAGGAMVATLSRMIREVDPAIAVVSVRTLDDVMGRSIAAQRLRVVPAAGFALLALCLAVLGIAAVLARTVIERRRELAIRAALGATPRQSISIVVAYGIRLLAIGLAAGLVAAAALTPLLRTLLYGVQPLDPATFIAVALLMTAAALLAAYLPARRAAHVNPIELLRA
jgi:putative ABC transport system permease protein